MLKATLLLVSALFLTACAQKDPLETTIRSATYEDYAHWRSNSGPDLSKIQWQDFDAAVQEVKFDIMMRGKARGSENQQALTLDTIRGKTMREIILLGFGLKRTRLENDKKGCEQQIAENAKLVTREGDYEAAEALAKRRKDHADFYEKVCYELSQTEKLLARYQVAPAK